MNKIRPCLWFNGNAEEAVKFYTSVFTDSKILNTVAYGKEGPLPEGTVMTIIFSIQGQHFMALNAWAEHSFNPSISFTAFADTQEELDGYWNKLTADGGKPIQCGWLTDKFGISWQITPTILSQYMQDKDPAKRDRVMKAFSKMVKFDIAELTKAYEG